VGGAHEWTRGLGDIEQAEMDLVFNQGIGFVMIVQRDRADEIQQRLRQSGAPTTAIGEVRAGEPGVEWE